MALAGPDESSRVVRSRGLEPPRVAPLAPQASASTNSATTADGIGAGRMAARIERRVRCNKSTLREQGPWFSSFCLLPARRGAAGASALDIGAMADVPGAGRLEAKADMLTAR